MNQYWIFYLLIFIAFGGCGKKASHQDSESKKVRAEKTVSKEPDLHIVAALDTFPVGVEEIPFIIINNATVRVIVGDEYFLDYFDSKEDKWVNTLPHNLVFTLVAHEISPGKKYVHYVRLFQNERGLYRVVIHIDNPFHYTLCAKFVLSENVNINKADLDRIFLEIEHSIE